jgi:hypothetical protein
MVINLTSKHYTYLQIFLSGGRKVEIILQKNNSYIIIIE